MAYYLVLNNDDEKFDKLYEAHDINGLCAGLKQSCRWETLSPNTTLSLSDYMSFKGMVAAGLTVLVQHKITMLIVETLNDFWAIHAISEIKLNELRQVYHALTFIK